MSDPSRAESLRDLEHEVGVIIRRVRRVVGVRARMVHEQLQPATYLILSWIDHSGPVRASEVAEQFDVDKGAVSRQVKHLVDLGLVQAERDPDDARAWLLSVTDEARTRLADVSDHRRKWLDEQLAGWSAADLAEFAGTLARYNSSLNEAD